MKKIFLAFIILISAGNLFAQPTKTEKSIIDNFLTGWSFWSDTNPNKANVTLPHDAMQTETRQQFGGGQHSGYYPGNVYHYEKTINIDKTTLNKHVVLKFEGVYRNAIVSVNGKQVASNKYGWTAFTANLDGSLKVGKNVIRVDADNSQVPNSRWYTGAGIYRPVRLVIQNKTHIDNVKVTTVSVAGAGLVPVLKKGHDIVEDRHETGPCKAIIAIKTNKNGGTVNVSIYDGKTKVAQAEGDNVKINIPNAKLWSAENPYLYKAVVTLRQNGKVVDTQEQEFGIRQITYSHDKGLMVNGKTVKLKGGCLHSDNGILGAAEYDDFAMRKIAIMKQYGFNAIRSAHNPCSEALLRACDKLGMYVMDELWDVWYDHKTPYDYATDFRANYQKDVDAFVEKDYNHPSVILYSIANEPTEVAKAEGVAMSKIIVDRLHQLDNSRPVTAGINLVIAYMSSLGINLTNADNAGAASGAGPKKMSSEEYNQMMAVSGQKLLDGVMKPEVDSVTVPEFETLDIAGYNYGSRRYEQDATEHPDRIVVGTETYPFMLADNWAKVEKLPYLIGDFQWTAWDYNGEVGLGAWYHSNENPPSIKPYPWKLAYAGSIDLIGNPTGEAFLAKAIWDKDDKPYIGVRPIDNRPLIKGMWRGTDAIPSWSWRGCEGMPATVEVFTSAKTVDLYLNDRLIGTEPVKDYVATFTVPYQSGTLKAVTTSDDGTKYENVLKSADSNLRISIANDCFAGEGLVPSLEKGHNIDEGRHKTGPCKGLLFVSIDIIGSNGIVESKADRQLTVKVDGGELLGFGSAQPCTEETFQSGKYTTYFGRSQAIIRPGKGKVKITVSGEGLPTVTKTLNDKSIIDIPFRHLDTPWTKTDGGYRNTLLLSQTEFGQGKFILDIGNKESKANVKVNNKYGIASEKTPSRFDITNLLQAGNNTIDIETDSVKGPVELYIETPDPRPYHSIKPGQVIIDNNGKPIQAHGFQIFEKDGTYYWYGENKEKTRYGSHVWTWGIRCYKSKDFYNWEDCGLIIPPDTINPLSPLHYTQSLDRPHIIYCPNTGKYVCWIKSMDEDGYFVVLQADDFLGPYKYVRSLKPEGFGVGDFDLWASSPSPTGEGRGGAAFVWFERPHWELICATLTDDYTNVTDEYSEHFVGRRPPFTREAPTHFVRNGRHYLFTSGTTGYYPNETMVCTFTDPHGKYTELGNPHPTDKWHHSFGSQITDVVKIPGKDLYIAVADRWMPQLTNTTEPMAEAKRMISKYKDHKPFDRDFSMPHPKDKSKEVRTGWDITYNGTYVFLPIKFVGGKPRIDWQDEWTISSPFNASEKH